MPSLRPLLGVTALLAAAVCAGAVSLTQALRLGPEYRYADVIEDYDRQRLNEVRPRLPPFQAVEYVDDHPPGADRAAPTGYATQYAVAPAVVVIGQGRQERFLLDGRPDVPPDLEPDRRAVLEYDAGNGVRLYRAEGP
jgi:hypothetical protein